MSSCAQNMDSPTIVHIKIIKKKMKTLGQESKAPKKNLRLMTVINQMWRLVIKVGSCNLQENKRKMTTFSKAKCDWESEGRGNAAYWRKGGYCARPNVKWTKKQEGSLCTANEADTRAKLQAQP